MAVYKEKIFSAGITMILGAVTLILAMITALQIVLGPLGSRPAPTSFLAGFTLLFVLITWNFTYLSIVLTKEYVQAGYGIFRKKLHWKDIRAVEADDKHHFYGYGARFGPYKGDWIWIYNVIGGQRVVFLTRNNKPRGLMVSTKDPDELIKQARARMSK